MIGLEKQLNDKKWDPVSVCLVIVCVITNLSQLPFFVTRSSSQLVSVAAWFVLALFMLLKRSFRIVDTRVLGLLKYAYFFAVLMFIQGIFTGIAYYQSSLLYSYFLSVFIYFIGFFAAGHVDEKKRQVIAYAYVISAFIVSFIIYIQYFGVSLSALSSHVYQYASKNSISQIIVTAIVLLLVMIRPKTWFGKLIWFLVLTFEVVFMFLLRSRATIVEFLVIVLVLLFSSAKARHLTRRKGLILTAVAVLLLALFISKPFYQFFVNGILLAGRDASSLDSISSGRITIIRNALPILKEHWISGIGHYYIDCFPIAACLQFGLLGALLLFISALYPMAKARRLLCSSEWKLTLWLLTAAYFTNGIFECLSPFGPGVKCYFLWLLFGLLQGRREADGQDCGREDDSVE